MSAPAPATSIATRSRSGSCRRPPCCSGARISTRHASITNVLTGGEKRHQQSQLGHRGEPAAGVARASASIAAHSAIWSREPHPRRRPSGSGAGNRSITRPQELERVGCRQGEAPIAARLPGGGEPCERVENVSSSGRRWRSPAAGSAARADRYTRRASAATAHAPVDRVTWRCVNAGRFGSSRERLPTRSRRLKGLFDFVIRLRSRPPGDGHLPLSGAALERSAYLPEHPDRRGASFSWRRWIFREVALRSARRRHRLRSFRGAVVLVLSSASAP